MWWWCSAVQARAVGPGRVGARVSSSSRARLRRRDATGGALYVGHDRCHDLGHRGYRGGFVLRTVSIVDVVVFCCCGHLNEGRDYSKTEAILYMARMDVESPSHPAPLRYMTLWEADKWRAGPQPEAFRVGKQADDANLYHNRHGQMGLAATHHS